MEIEGIDGIFIGPADLSVDLGYPPTADVPEIQKIVLDAIDRIVARGKAAGILTLDRGFITVCLKHRATFVATGIDVLTLAFGLRQLANTGRDAANAV